MGMPVASDNSCNDILFSESLKSFSLSGMVSFVCIAVIEITEEYMKERIYEIRGQRVILDSDLSEIYGYTTKAFNQQVKNNIEKFDEDFMFELTDDEVEDLRSNF